jgi:hypothetical protein
LKEHRARDPYASSTAKSRQKVLGYDGLDQEQQRGAADDGYGTGQLLPNVHGEIIGIVTGLYTV